MDAVVIATILALAGTIAIIGYFAYKFFRIICSTEDTE